MAVPRNSLKPSRASVAWDAVKLVLQTDPDLSRAVRLWRFWDGSTSAVADPAPSQLPWVRVTPGAGPSGWRFVRSHEMRLIIQFEIATEGTDARNAMDLWGAIINAVYPDDTLADGLERRTFVLNKYQDSYIMGAPEFVQAVYSPVIVDGSFLHFYGQGALSLLLHAAT